MCARARSCRMLAPPATGSALRAAHWRHACHAGVGRYRIPGPQRMGTWVRFPAQRVPGRSPHGGTPGWFGCEMRALHSSDPRREGHDLIIWRSSAVEGDLLIARTRPGFPRDSKVRGGVGSNSARAGVPSGPLTPRVPPGCAPGAEHHEVLWGPSGPLSTGHTRIRAT